MTGKPLEGAKFSVTYGSNNTVTGEINDLGTFYTDENGQFILTRLRDGWYKVTELASVPGYQLPDGNAVQTLFVGGGSNAAQASRSTPTLTSQRPRKSRRRTRWAMCWRWNEAKRDKTPGLDAPASCFVHRLLSPFGSESGSVPDPDSDPQLKSR